MRSSFKKKIVKQHLKHVLYIKSCGQGKENDLHFFRLLTVNKLEDQCGTGCKQMNSFTVYIDITAGKFITQLVTLNAYLFTALPLVSKPLNPTLHTFLTPVTFCHAAITTAVLKSNHSGDNACIHRQWSQYKNDLYYFITTNSKQFTV